MPFFVGFAIFTVAKSSLNSQDLHVSILWGGVPGYPLQYTQQQKDLHSIQATLPESVHSATVPAPQKNARRSY